MWSRTINFVRHVLISEKAISEMLTYSWINTRQRLVNKDGNLWMGGIEMCLGDASVYGVLFVTLPYTQMSSVLSVFCLIYVYSTGD